jgi:hypothetical protein
MSATDTNVIVTEYRAQFTSLPFAPGSGAWRLTGGMEYRFTLPRRRRATVAAEYWPCDVIPASQTPVGAEGYIGIHPSMLVDQNAVVVFVPDSPGARFGTAVLIEQIKR